MRINLKACVSIVFLLLSLLPESVAAQAPAADRLNVRAVTASSSGKQARFTALGELVEIRLEVINSSGTVVFDSGFKAGNVLDWELKDNEHNELTDGSYLCAITVKNSSGQITKRTAIANVSEHSATLKPVVSLHQHTETPLPIVAAHGLDYLCLKRDRRRLRC